jgi:hypothetical protein
MSTEFFLQWEECGERILLGDNTADRWDCSVLDFEFKLYSLLCTRI